MERRFSIILSLVFVSFFASWPTMAQAPKAPKTQDVFIYDDHSRRDPLMPLVTPSGEIVKFSSELSGSDLALEGIMYAPNGKGIAMVNGKLLNVGDDIGPFTVVEITQFTVILSKGEGKIELKLKRGD